VLADRKREGREEKGVEPKLRKRPKAGRQRLGMLLRGR